MFNRIVATVIGAGAIIAAAAHPAGAQDEIAQTAQVCGACHGASGTPTDPKTMPIIWGQQSNYLFKELHDYHSGDRASPIMAPLAKGMQFDELRKLAAFFAAKTWPAPATPAAAATAPEGIVMCKACHGQNFEGGAPAPRLAGLSYEYLSAQMRNFADGTRTNNGDMPGFMKALTEDQRDAMARYLAGL